ncbi:spore germination protein [Proteinivorax hydrogeniformans]|uniref:Spore germination protein n=1 Tax=Proteinivorax hydrogeniformans TaxID=1826727 RepID=A0AAU8HUT4_9FIRM
MKRAIKKLIRKVSPPKSMTQSMNNSSNGKKVYSSLKKNHDYLKNLFKDCDDIDFRKIKIADSSITVLIVYVDGLAAQETIGADIVKSLTVLAPKSKDMRYSKQNIHDSLLSTAQAEEQDDFDNVVESLLGGEALVFVDGINGAFSIDIRSWEGRSVEEPSNEQTIRGPREGFTETLRFNTALIRRRLKNNDLKMKHFKVGRQSKTDVVITYFASIADDTVVREVEERIKKIDIDGVLESSYIEELIEERTISIFPQILNTERPDRAVGHLLEGKVVILVDNTPFALVLPVTLAQFFHSPEDHYNRYIYTFITRIFRFAGFFLATCLPAIYVILTSFRYEMIPIDIIFSIAETREELPFTPFMEALLLEVIVEFLREATLRLPGPIGQTIGIVGALVIGEAAVQARLISPILVIFTATTMLGSFAIPNYNMASSVRLLRFPLLFASGLLGGFGFVLTWMVIFIHICNLQSFGVPFLQPFSPLKLSEQRDNIFRAPIRWMRRRPVQTAKTENLRRQIGVENDDEKTRKKKD